MLYVFKISCKRASISTKLLYYFYYLDSMPQYGFFYGNLADANNPDRLRRDRRVIPVVTWKNRLILTSTISFLRNFYLGGDVEVMCPEDIRKIQMQVCDEARARSVGPILFSLRRETLHLFDFTFDRHYLSCRGSRRHRGVQYLDILWRRVAFADVQRLFADRIRKQNLIQIDRARRLFCFLWRNSRGGIVARLENSK